MQIDNPGCGFIVYFHTFYKWNPPFYKHIICQLVILKLLVYVKFTKAILIHGRDKILDLSGGILFNKLYKPNKIWLYCIVFDGVAIAAQCTATFVRSIVLLRI